ARLLGANAYTSGEDIVFRQDKYAPDSPQGRHLLAHELTHVVRQRGTGQTGAHSDAEASMSVPSDPEEVEAERIASESLASANQQEDFAFTALNNLPDWRSAKDQDATIGPAGLPLPTTAAISNAMVIARSPASDL